MTVKDLSYASINGGAHEVSTDMAGQLPGKPFGTALITSGEPENDPSHFSTTSQPGPIVNSKPTTITLYASRSLKATGLVPAIHDLINEAFEISHSAFPSVQKRLDSHDHLVKDLSGPETFTYVVTYTGTKTVIGVASAKPYKDNIASKPPSKDNPDSCFRRSGTFKPKAEGWELSLMAVDPKLQRQGLASLLMKLVEDELKRRFLLTRAEKGLPNLKLVLLLTTVKEVNWVYYVRRGYSLDYETVHEPGWYPNSGGFHVVHMSKKVEV